MRGKGCGLADGAPLTAISACGFNEVVRAGKLIAKRWPVVCGVLLVAAVGGLLWWSPWVPREPVYEGKPLSHHLTSFEMWTVPPPDELAIDSNAVPFLIKALKRDTWSGAAYYRKQLWPRLPVALKRHLPPPTDHADIRCPAAMALDAGHDRRAVPAFVKALQEDDSSAVRGMAASYLGYLAVKEDRAVIAALAAAANDHRDGSVQSQAADALWRLHREAYTSTGARGVMGVNVMRWDDFIQLLKTDPEAAAKAGVKPPSP